MTPEGESPLMRRLFGFRSARPLAVPPEPGSPGDQAATCSRCGARLAGAPRFVRYRVCDACGAHFPIAARARVATLVDPGTFRETDANLSSTDPLAFADDLPYLKRLSDLRRATGQADALLTGSAEILGHGIALAVLDFAFMGGSMGVVVGEKMVRAAETALERRRPLVTMVASGGARMQEGMLSLLQMAKTAAAVQRLHVAGVPYLSVLTNPTTGGVLASFASLGDVIVAEPNALIGFAGPRVVEQFLGKSLPPGSHSSEFLLGHGMIDDVVDRERLREYLGTVLDLLDPPKKHDWSAPATRRAQAPPGAPPDVWATVTTARAPDRPTTMDYVERILDTFVELHGDRESGDDPAIVAGLGKLDGHPVAVVGFERGHGEEAARRRQGRPMPEGFRKAQRVMRLAARCDLPLLTLIDTPGAYPGIESEERGLAGAIAESMALMSDLPVPIVAVVVGEGGSGGALALAVADRVLMQAGAIYSVIAPEGAAAILYRDADRAPEIAAKLKITASNLVDLGIVDTVVPEPLGGAAADPDSAADSLRAAILAAMAEVGNWKRARLVQRRCERYRAVGRSFTAPAPLRGDGDRKDAKARSGEGDGVSSGVEPGGRPPEPPPGDRSGKKKPASGPKESPGALIG